MTHHPQDFDADPDAGTAAHTDDGPAAPGQSDDGASAQAPAQHLELELGPQAHGGHTVARTPQGRVVFVRHGAPGERVRVRLTETGDDARYWRGDVVEVLRAADGRREAHPWAPADSPRSWAQGQAPVGGAELGHLELAAQRRLKTDVLRELLGGIGGFDAQELEALDVDVEALPGESPDGLGWRTRAHFAVDAQGRPGMHPHRSDELVAVDGFPLMVPALQQLGIGSLDWSGAARLDLAAPSGDAPSVLVTARGRRSQALADQLRDHAVPALQQAHASAGGAGTVSVVLADDPEAGGARREPLVLAGAGRAREVVGAGSWEVSVGGFWQVHRSAPARLLELVAQSAGLEPGESALDLYSGAGLLTAALADAVGLQGRVLGVEGSPLTSADAARNFAAAPQVEAVTGSVEQVLAQRWPGIVRIPQRLRRGSGHGSAGSRGRSRGAGRDRRRAGAAAGKVSEPQRRPDVVVLDPPRAGAGKVVVDAIAALEPRRIVSVSCDPATLARDLARFRHRGWTVRSLRGLDLYPNTHHLETVTVLERS